MNKIKWDWCWHCNIATALCPDCDGGSCSAGCFHPERICERNNWWSRVRAEEDAGLSPKFPTIEHIQARLDWLRQHWDLSQLSEAERLIFQENPSLHPFSESRYWAIKTAAEKFEYPIPTLEEFAAEFNESPIYDCATSEEYQAEEKQHGTDFIIGDPDGWDRMNFNYSWYEERIPWEEYLRRKTRSTLMPK